MCVVFVLCAFSFRDLFSVPLSQNFPEHSETFTQTAFQKRENKVICHIQHTSSVRSSQERTKTPTGYSETNRYESCDSCAETEKHPDSNQFNFNLSGKEQTTHSLAEYAHTRSNNWVKAEGQSNKPECSGPLWTSHGSMTDCNQCLLCVWCT